MEVLLVELVVAEVLQYHAALVPVPCGEVLAWLDAGVDLKTI